MIICTVSRQYFPHLTGSVSCPNSRNTFPKGSGCLYVYV